MQEAIYTEVFSKPSPGFKLTIDNVDYHQNVHYMTEEYQNIDRHYVTENATINRVSGNHLSSVVSLNGVKDMENVFPTTLNRRLNETITLLLSKGSLWKIFLV